jgi:HAE1 family hydrophobic/amphiphilic exporter-1
MDGTVGVDTTWRSGKPEVRIYPDRKKLSDHGVDIRTFATLMRTYLEGTVAGEFRELDEEYDIRVKLRNEDRKSAHVVKDMLIPLPEKGVVPVTHFSRVESAHGPTQILRKDKQRLVVISMDTKGRSMGEVAEELDNEIDKIGLPPGYYTHQGGRVEHMKESFADILTAFTLAIILTYLVLAALLESYARPFSIMLTVPLSLIGVWIGLYLTKSTFNIFSMMAVVMLVGIVVNNAILIIDYTLTLMGKGQKRNEALRQAATTRLRPILMTTLAAAFAMLPLALAWGWGAEMRSPMAIASIGGLISSAALTLFVVPVMYTYLDDLTHFLRKAIRRG